MPPDKPSNWSNIPAEVLYYILKEVADDKSMLQCQHVCKAWKEPSQRAACRKVRLTKYKQLVAFVRTLQERRGLGKVVRHINFENIFSSDEGPWDPQDCFTELDKYCPNVKALMTSRSCPSLWLRLSLERNKWRHLKRIPQPFDVEGIELYTVAAIALRDRLTDLYLFDCINSNVAPRPASDGHYLFEELAEKLAEFQQLNHLEIRKYNTSQLCYLDEYLDNCPKLTKLQVNLFPTIDDLDVNGRSMLGNTLLSTFPSRETMEYIKKVKPKNHIKELAGSVPLREDEHLSYIMQAFPILSSINLNVELELTSLAVTRILNAASTPTLMSNFLCYLLNIPKYRVQYLYTNDVKAALSEFWNSQAYKEKRGSNHVSLGISYTIIEPYADIPFLDGFKIPCLFVSQHHKVSVVFPANEGVEYAHRELIEITGPLLTHLSINLSTRSSQICIPHEDDMLNGYYLDHIFKHCHSLKNLTWSQQRLLYCNPEASINRSIENLVIDHTRIHTEILSQLSVRLPLLKKLTLLNYTFIKFDGIPVKSRHTLIDMPYTNFEMLHLQEYGESPNVYTYLYIKYSCATGDEYRAVVPQQENLGSKRFIRCTVDNYSKALGSKDAFTIQVRCQSIRYLRVTMGGLNRTLNLQSK